jgi:hypothetical protein
VNIQVLFEKKRKIEKKIQHQQQQTNQQANKPRDIFYSLLLYMLMLVSDVNNKVQSSKFNGALAQSGLISLV